LRSGGDRAGEHRGGHDPNGRQWDIAVEVGPADSYSDNPDLELDAWIARAVAELG
jgi:hypothetical protein